MKFYCPKRNRHLIALLLAGMFLVPAWSLALNTAETGFKVETSDQRINAHGVCLYLNSKTATDWFVPTKSATEWADFRGHSNFASRFDNYACGLRENGCRIKYQQTTDEGETPIGYTPYTNNTTTYQVGPMVIDKHGKDDHCNGSGCGIRAGVYCTDTDYAIRVKYQYQVGNVNAPERFSAWSDASSAMGDWSKRNHEDGDNECKSSTGGCKIRMEVETDNPAVTCSIGYRHRADTAVSPLAYDWNWATLNESGDGGENCNKSTGGCGMEVRLYCDGPGGSFDANDVGACGAADGGSFGSAGALLAVGACLTGTTNPVPSGNGPGSWNWTCEGSGGGGDDTCSASYDSTATGILLGGETPTTVNCSSGFGSPCSPIGDICRVLVHSGQGGPSYANAECF